MILLAAVAAVLALAAIMPLLVRVLGRDAGYVGAAVFVGLAVWLARPAPDVLAGEPVTGEMPWVPAAGLSVAFRMDALGWLFAQMVLVVGALVLAYGARYFGRGDRAKAGRFLALLTFFAAAMLGLVLADDAVLLFVFWELTSVSSFFLIGGKGEGGPGATRAFLTTALGGLALLAGVLLIGTAAGTFSLAEILADPAPVVDSAVAPAVIVLLLLAAGTKSAQFPFHYWLPGAMVAPTPVSTYLHAATMVKAGIYLLFRFTPVFGGVPAWQVTLVLVGLGTAVFGAVVALKRTDLKGLLAYSTVSQLGFLTGLIGIGTPLALAAAGLHTIAHALYKAALFMTVGVVDHETGTRDLREISGLRRHLPLTAAAGGLAAVSMAGLPPLVGFVSKEEAFAAFVEVGSPAWLGPVAATLAVVASLGTFAYSARYYLGTFEGPDRGIGHAAPRLFDTPALVCAAAGLALGLVVPRLDPLVNAIARDTTGTDPDLHLALWHGLTVPLALSAIVIGGGALLVALRRRVQAWQEHVTTPSGASVFDLLHARAVDAGALIGRSATSHAPATYLLPVLAVLVLAPLGIVATTDLAVTGDPAPSLRPDWAVVILLACCIAGVVQSRSRLGAVATLGLTGFTVAGWFVLIGAPDLALTQLLIETLTVALVVVVFRRLPTAFTRGGPPRKIGAAGVAATLGLLAGGATYLLTGRRGLSDTGARFLAEGEGLTGGENVVNTILVDFRALDTLGEIGVLAVAAAGIVAIVRMSERAAVPRPSHGADDTTGGGTGRAGGTVAARGRGMIDSLVLSTATMALAPAMIAASLWLLVRGHDAVGGGFIGGLVGGAAAVLVYFSRGHGRIWESRLLRTVPLVGSGLVVAILYGLGGLLLAGSFLSGAKIDLPFGIEIAASLVFDVGVYLVVIGMVVAILRHLGQGIEEEAPHPDRAAARHVPSRAGEGVGR